MRAMVLERLAAKRGADDLDVLARAPERLAQATPCQPSTTCGPDVPRPSRTRPPESRSSVAAVIAVIAGVRAGICMIAVPIPICSVVAAIQVRG